MSHTIKVSEVKTPPYFVNPIIDRLASATGGERVALVRRIAALVGDEAALRSIIGIDPAEFVNFYPDMMPTELSTEDTISSFISHFSSRRAADTPEVEQLIAAPAIDYAAMLEEEDSATPENSDPDQAYDPDETADPGQAAAPDETAALISNFLQAVPPKRPSRKPTPAPPAAAPTAPTPASSTPAAAPTTPTPASSTPAAAPTIQRPTGAAIIQSPPVQQAPAQSPDDSLSEALFKLMVKNKNYAKALEIITELSLNNPKKSIYFAYQIRFLKKLIKNQANERK